MSWTSDGTGFFYSRFDSLKKDVDDDDEEESEQAAKWYYKTKIKSDMELRQETEKLSLNKVYFHRVGTMQHEDELIYSDEANPNYLIRAEVSHDGDFLIMSTMKDAGDVC